jgi:hypothetical protein
MCFSKDGRFRRRRRVGSRGRSGSRRGRGGELGLKKCRMMAFVCFYLLDS